MSADAPETGSPPPVLVHVVRDGFVESVHRGHVAVVAADGSLLAGAGDPDVVTYPRSALKPFQAVATLALLADAGVELGPDSIAIATASHDGSAAHQIEAAYLLALADLEEDALQCPPALAADEPTRADQRGQPSSLAHNCSGKHAAFLLAQRVTGADPADYLDLNSELQVRVAAEIARLCGATPTGPGVDGCAAPAWRLPLSALATGFARLASGAGGLGVVRDAMRTRPELVGGALVVDTQLMATDPRIVAKRGAEAVFAAGFESADGPVGIAVKIADGASRAAGPVIASVLQGAGLRVPDAVLRPAVVGGGKPHGMVHVPPSVAAGLALAR